jgi:Ca-activated chloride channel family protein
MNKDIKSKIYSFLLLLFFLAGAVSNLYSDGFIVPIPRPAERIPPLSVKYHRVQVEITRQIAKTSIDQIFINDYHRDIEGIFIFPIPEKAAISEFSMYVGNQRIEGEILDRDQARKIYQDIVRSM